MDTCRYSCLGGITITDYVAAAKQAAIDAGIDPNIFVMQIQAESGFNPNAQSPAGAIGIAQFMPSTAQSMNVNPWDPIASLKAAAQLDNAYLQKYNGDWGKTLAAYNAGPGAVDSATSSCGSKWTTCLPAETQAYIKKILSAGGSVLANPGNVPPGSTEFNPPQPSSPSSCASWDIPCLLSEVVHTDAFQRVNIVLVGLILGIIGVFVLFVGHGAEVKNGKS